MISYKGTSINSDFSVSARKHRAQNRNVYGIHEDSSTKLTPQSREKTIYRGALNFVSSGLLMLIPVVLITSCAAGDAQFTSQDPAGFWFGVWHGIISIISLIIHLFNDNVSVYEVNNTGGWYDFGFLFGVICIWGGGSHMSCKTAAEKKHDKEWEEVGSKVEIKVMNKLKQWAENEEGTGSGDDWDEIGEKVEKKLKRKIREWAEKD